MRCCIGKLLDSFLAESSRGAERRVMVVLKNPMTICIATITLRKQKRSTRAGRSRRMKARRNVVDPSLTQSDLVSA